jgi:hypothetical protein
MRSPYGILERILGGLSLLTMPMITSCITSDDAATTKSLIEFRSIAEVTVPDSFVVRGATLVDSMTALAWAAAEARLLYASPARTEIIAVSGLGQPVGVHWNRETRTAEIVDAENKTFVTVDAHWRVKQRTPIEVAGEIVEAARDSAQWFLGIRLDTITFAVVAVRLDGSASPSTLTTLSATDARQFYWLTARNGGVVVTSMRRLGQQPLLSRTSDAMVLRAGNVIEENATTRDSLFRVGLRLVPLDTGFLQVVADLRSDERELVLLNEDGTMRRKLAIAAAMGALASDPDHNVILFARTLNAVDLVFYRWRWRNATQSTESNK